MNNTFTVQELQDLLNALDIMGGSYTPELEDALRESYGHGTDARHRLNRLFRILNDLIAQQLEHSLDA